MASDESQGNYYSSGGSISGDGRYVGFYSYAALVIPDSNGLVADVFVRDRTSGSTEFASVASNGMAGNDNSVGGALSTDGRYVGFRSDASNLVASDTNGRTDVFLRDRLTGSTERVSVASNGAQGNDYSYGGFATGSVSADGRFVAFWSYATNLVPADTNTYPDVFVRDRLTGVTERVSLASDGTQGNFPSTSDAVMSDDGRFVAFTSEASNLVLGDANGTTDVFVRDRLTNETSRVSVASDGMEANRPVGDTLSITADGRYVAYASEASNLVPGDTNSARDVFLRDRLTSTTKRVSLGNGGAQGNDLSLQPSLSSDGRFLIFRSLASNMVAVDTNNTSDVFVRDLQTGMNELVSVASDGTQANNSSAADVSISDDGRYAAFASDASNLVADDTNGSSDVFVHDREGAGPMPPASLSLTPDADTNPVGTVHTLSATVRNAANQPVSGVTVQFRVQGSTTTTGQCTTDAAGACSFTYTGPDLPGADSIVAYADSDNDSTQDPTEPFAEATKAWLLPASTPGQVTGGGQIPDPSDPNYDVAFGFNAQGNGSTLKGNCSVVDQSPAKNIIIKCKDVTSLVVSPTHATFFGNATVNGVATTYRIDVDDLAEPGSGADTFKIRTASGYLAAGTLSRGNIQIHV